MSRTRFFSLSWHTATVALHSTNRFSTVPHIIPASQVLSRNATAGFGQVFPERASAAQPLLPFEMRMGGGFESAILTVVNLREMGIKQIYARAEDLIAGEVFSKVGATEVIYSEIESAERWAFKLIAPQIGEKIDFAEGYSLARIKAPASFNGRTVMDLQLRQKHNVNLVLIKRGENSKQTKAEKAKIINVPMPGTVVYQGDILMVAGSDADLAKLPQE